MAMFVATACPAPDATECSGGGVCPRGYQCHFEGAEQFCALDDCGNGAVDHPEDCDDGNNDDDDGCERDCRWPIAPPARRESSLVFEIGTGRVVMFGGVAENVPLRDLWAYDGDWEVLAQPYVVPLASRAAAMAYDRDRGVVVLFGGLGTTGPNAQTWERDPSAWTLREPPVSPSERYGHAMVYDAGARRVVLFGGERAFAETFDDTWVYDGTTWTELVPATRPAPRSGAAMAYDARRGCVVMVGGTAADPDVWELCGGDWVRVAPAIHPPARTLAAASYDELRGRTVLFGGSSAGMFLADTWEWDGSAWTDRTSATASAPDRRYAHAMAYDAARGRTVLFAGTQYVSTFASFGDTWLWDGVAWREDL
jgi:cysteine-rich repeat protein